MPCSAQCRRWRLRREPPRARSAVGRAHEHRLIRHRLPRAARTGRATARAGLRAPLARPELLGLLGLAGDPQPLGAQHQRLGQHVLQRGGPLDEHELARLPVRLAGQGPGLMTVDKPPLALWVQALSARMFGFHPLSILIPQALMGVAAAA